MIKKYDYSGTLNVQIMHLISYSSRSIGRNFSTVQCIIWVKSLIFQVLIWAIIPSLKGSTLTDARNVLRFSIIIQYLPRLFLIFPLSKQIVKATGVVTETAWAGAAYNLMLYMLASHVSTNMISFQICFVLLFFLSVCSI